MECTGAVLQLAGETLPTKTILCAEKEMAGKVLSTLAKQQGYALDLGCGSGASYPLLPEGCTRVSLDRSPAMARRCRTAHHGLVVVADAHRLPFKRQSFFLISAIGLTEYLGNLQPFFSEAVSVLGMPGSFIVTTSPSGFYTCLRRLIGHRIAIHTREALLQACRKNNLLLAAVDRTFSQELYLLQTK